MSDGGKQRSLLERFIWGLVLLVLVFPFLGGLLYGLVWPIFGR